MRRLHVDSLESPIGTIVLVEDEGRLCSLDYTDYEQRMMMLLERRYGPVSLEPQADPCGAGQGHKKPGYIIVRSITPVQYIAGIFIRLQLFLLVLLLCAPAFKAQISGGLGARIELMQLLFRIGFAADCRGSRSPYGIAIANEAF